MYAPLRRGRRAALVGLLAAGLGATVAGAPADASTGPGGPLPTVVAGTPVVIVDFAHVQVVASTPLWTFARTSAGAVVPVSWHTASALPASQPVTYDVQFRQTQGLAGPSFSGPWRALVTGTGATSAALASGSSWTIWNGDAYEFEVRAVNPDDGAVGPWSAPVVSNLPLDDNWHNQAFEHGDFGDMRFGSHWSILASPYAYYGKQHTTTERTVVYGGLSGWYGHRLYIFGTTCPTCGKFTISMQVGPQGGTLIRPVTVDTYSPATHHRVVLYQVDVPQHLMYVYQLNTLATLHRPRVILDGWGVSH
jgi:hypothetical protein